MTRGCRPGALADHEVIRASLADTLAGDPGRRLEGLVLSAHRAGGIPAALRQVGDMVLDDLTLLKRGLPPARLQIAARELVGRYRHRPVR